MLKLLQELIVANHQLIECTNGKAIINGSMHSHVIDIENILNEMTETDLEHIGIFTDETGNLEIGEGYRRVILTK